MEDKIIATLRLVGLHKNEVEIYIDLIGHRNSTALEISKRTRIHRSNVYDILRNLVEKGFVYEILEEKRRLFKASEPQKIKEYVKREEEEVDEIMPLLQQYTNQTEEQEGVSIGKGVFAVREALIDLLKLKKPINIYGASQIAINVFGPGFLKEFHSERMKQKITMRHIYNKEELKRVKRLNKMRFTEAKYFSKKYDSFVSTNLCGDTVIIILFNHPVTVITIKNQKIADAYNAYFEILWKQAKVM